MYNHNNNIFHHEVRPVKGCVCPPQVSHCPKSVDVKTTALRSGHDPSHVTRVPSSIEKAGLCLTLVLMNNYRIQHTKSWRQRTTGHKDNKCVWAHTVHRPGDDSREDCGNARGSNVRYYPTWKHSPLNDYWLTNAHELLNTEWLKY
jgi:hypothetical protein